MIKLELKNNYKYLIIFILIAILSFSLTYFNNYISIPYTLVSLFLSLKLGSNILTYESSSKTIEYLYSKPLSKKKIILWKVISSIIILSIYLIITAIINFLILKISNNLNIKLFLKLICNEILMLSYTFSFSLFISTIYLKNAKSLDCSLIFVLIEYIILDISKTVSEIKYLTYFSIYNNLTRTNLIVSFVFIVIILLLSFFNYNRKEFKNG